MHKTGFRVVVPFCDQWADPGPDGACHDACLEALRTELERLDPSQRPAWWLLRYVGAVDAGGHAPFFGDLSADASAQIAGTIEALFLLGLDHAADILARAHSRWAAGGTAFSDLDDEYNILGLADPADHPPSVLDTYLRENIELFVDLASPGPDDQQLIEIGNPLLHRDGGRAAWFTLALHESPRVRLKCARNLLGTDREDALRIARGVRDDPRASEAVRERVQTLFRSAGIAPDDC